VGVLVIFLGIRKFNFPFPWRVFSILVVTLHAIAHTVKKNVSEQIFLTRMLVLLHTFYYLRPCRLKVNTKWLMNNFYLFLSFFLSLSERENSNRLLLSGMKSKRKIICKMHIKNNTIIHFSEGIWARNGKWFVVTISIQRATL